MNTEYLERILTARVYDVAVETPLELAPNLSRRLNNRIYLKREDMQPVFSFKLRGAYNKMANLPADKLKAGVVTASAGNHAQGVALSAQVLGCQATIVMPATTPKIKVDAVASRGGKVILIGDSFSDANQYAMDLVESSGMTFIPPYDDPDVIAGQGTIGMEILRQHSAKLHAVFIPIGGGGLAAGVAAYIKRVRPQIKVIGVEPVDSCAMHQSIQQGEIVTLPTVGLFADGVAVKQVGEETFRLCRELLDDIILVDTDQMCAAIKDVFEDTRSILEPSGALSLAGIKVYLRQHPEIQDESLVAIASGANVNFDRLRHVAERAELGEQREAIIAACIPEKRGSFREFCSLLGSRNITEFNYRYSDANTAHLFVGIQIQERSEVDSLLRTLAEHDLKAIDLTDNEMAKLHIRHMVGGHAPHVKDELVFRFEFPERPRALLDFLNGMSKQNWNISLFHYRNHGTDYGRVLVGVQVPAADKALFRQFLQESGYTYEEETDNPAYKMFLGGNAFSIESPVSGR